MPMSISPEEQAAIMARTVRGRPLMEANQQAHAADLPTMAAMMANNPALSQAAQFGAKQRQQQFKPVQMGQQGFALPATGEFVQSPMFEEEQNAQRLSREAIAEGNRVSREAIAEQQRQAQLERTRMAMEQRALLAEQQRQLRLTLAAMAGGRAQEKAAEKAEKDATAATLKLGQDQDRRLSRLGTMLDKTGIADFEAALDIAEGRLNMHGPDIPGFGKLESLKPDWLQGLTDEEGMAARQDMQMAANILLKSRSGAAVTNSEAQRFLREVAMGKVMSEENLRHGWKNVRKVFNAKMRNILSTVSKEDLDEYNARTGRSLSHGVAPEAAPVPSKSDKPAAPAAGAPKRIRVDLQGNVIP